MPNYFRASLKTPVQRTQKAVYRDMKNMQLGFFDTENRYERLTQLGDPLERLNGAINWEMFRGKLTKVCQKENYTKGGRPPIDVIIKFKASILRRIYNLSYDQIEYQINDRLSFMRFLGLGLEDRVLNNQLRSNRCSSTRQSVLYRFARKQ